MCLRNLLKHQRPDIDKIYLYGKDPFESKCQLLINRIEKVGSENLKNQKSLILHKQLMMFMKTKTIIQQRKREC